MKRDFDSLRNGPFDVLVVGGGIYGAWVAYEAALRGMSVALVDRADWASGTSSASSKLLHGGLRYLERYEFGLVRKSLQERKLLHALRRILAVRELPGFPQPDGGIRSVRRFDEIYTAPDGGFATAEEYYAWASAGPRLGGLARPATVISAADDPFVPVELFAPHSGLKRARFLHPKRGGHCGYWQASRPRFWAAEAILQSLE